MVITLKGFHGEEIWGTWLNKRGFIFALLCLVFLFQLLIVCIAIFPTLNQSGGARFPGAYFGNCLFKVINVAICFRGPGVCFYHRGLYGYLILTILSHQRLSCFHLSV